MRKWVSVRPSPESLLAIFIIELLDKPMGTSFPPVHGGSQTTSTVGVVSLDYKPLALSTTMVRASTEWMQTSLNTMPKPIMRAQAMV